jgi:hypothetical protein
VAYKVGSAIFLIAVYLNSSSAAQPLNDIPSHPSPEAYIARRGGTLIPPGRTEIDGRRMECGSSPTVLDLHLRDFGSAFKGFLVLNPTLFADLAAPVKLWIFSHECAHQTVGPDEVKADCIAVQRGRKEGWLTADGLEQVCKFMKPAHADRSHFTGTRRCGLMQQCFQESKKELGR